MTRREGNEIRIIHLILMEEPRTLLEIHKQANLAKFFSYVKVCKIVNDSVKNKILFKKEETYYYNKNYAYYRY